MSNSVEIGKEIGHNCSSHSEDEEESLSLCDLPLASTVINQEGEKEDGKQRAKLAKTPTKSEKGVSEDFDFGSLAASLDALESEMCAADEVFFRGQILPFRHSVSSATAASNPTGTISRSESMDRNAGSGFQSSSTASSSRSSSTRSSSINSSASAGKLPPPQSNSINHSTKPTFHKRESKIRNQFHSFPSPKPYARASNAHRSSINSLANKRSSALWEIFRLGLVRTPEIELEDLKIRCNKQQHNLSGGRSEVVISRNSSSGGSENGRSVNNRSCKGEWRSVKNKKELKKQKKNGAGGAMSFMSCKCTAEAVVPPGKGGKGKVVVNKEEEETKHDVSRHHRTFEWLKDLSHAVVLNDVSS